MLSWHVQDAGASANAQPMETDEGKSAEAAPADMDTATRSDSSVQLYPLAGVHLISTLDPQGLLHMKSQDYVWHFLVEQSLCTAALTKKLMPCL